MAEPLDNRTIYTPTRHPSNQPAPHSNCADLKGTLIQTSPRFGGKGITIQCIQLFSSQSGEHAEVSWNLYTNVWDEEAVFGWGSFVSTDWRAIFLGVFHNTIPMCWRNAATMRSSKLVTNAYILKTQSLHYKQHSTVFYSGDRPHCGLLLIARGSWGENTKVWELFTTSRSNTIQYQSFHSS